MIRWRLVSMIPAPPGQVALYASLGGDDTAVRMIRLPVVTFGIYEEYVDLSEDRAREDYYFPVDGRAREAVALVLNPDGLLTRADWDDCDSPDASFVGLVPIEGPDPEWVQAAIDRALLKQKHQRQWKAKEAAERMVKAASVALQREKTEA